MGKHGGAGKGECLSARSTALGDAGHGVPWPVQKIVGALQGNHAKKGVFITTASFSQEAEHYAENLDCKVVLIDGKCLSGRSTALGDAGHGVPWPT